MLVADITFDHRVMPKGEITIDLSAPFDAHQFYVQMRDWGLNPYVSTSGVYCGVNGPIEDMRVFEWAAKDDPDGSKRREHARAAWEGRASDDEIIPLGLREGH
jgi:hypothetical protein